MIHNLRPIGARPLHPAEVVMVAAAIETGMYVGQCSCGTVMWGVNDIDLACNFRDHRRAVKAVAL